MVLILGMKWENSFSKRSYAKKKKKKAMFMQRSCHKVGSYQLTFDTPVGDEVTALSNGAVMVGSL